MNTRILKSLALAAALLGAPVAMAQVTGGSVTGGGITGISGVSGGLGSDFAGSQVSGATNAKDGGLAASLEEAFTGEKDRDNAKPMTDCGKRDCDE